jgi:hypothetical protein
VHECVRTCRPLTSRLNISGNSSRMAGESSCGDNTGQASASNTTFESGIYSTRTKRARYDPDERSSTTMPLLDGINIVDDDSVHPRFLKLINNSKQDLAFNGWILKRKVGSQSFEFKFPRGMILSLHLVDMEFRCQRYIGGSADQFEITHN